jgi:ABC-type transport system involved in cytochrome c biogenesis permease component
MTFLPIVGRELRVAARHRGLYRTRFGAAAVAILIFGWALLTASSVTPGRLAQNIFFTNAVLAFIYCLLAGAINTADCISEEKRDGTLGLLFLTDLKGYDVVLGKLAATSIGSVYGLVAIFPVMAVPLLLGGVDWGQVGRMALLLLNTLFFSLAAGVFASTVSRDDRRAAGSAVLLVGSVTGGLPLLGWCYLEYIKKASGDPPLGWLLPSPAFAMNAEMTHNTAPVPAEFWWSLLTTHSIGWLLLGLASLVLPRIWQDRPSTVRRDYWRERWQQWAYGNSTERSRFRTRLLSANPYYWLAGRDRLKPAYVWLFLGACCTIWLWAYVKFRKDWLDEWNYFLSALFLHTVLKIWLASEACRRIGEDRHNGALELLLSTPLTVANILRGQLLALWRQFAGPVALVLAIDFLFLSVGGPRGQISSGWIDAWLAWMVTLAADLYALGCVSMHLGLTAPRVGKAVRGALLRILVLPPLLCFAGLVLIYLLRPPGLTAWLDQNLLVLWFATGFVVDIWFWRRSRRRMLAEFREAAAQRYERSTDEGASSILRRLKRPRKREPQANHA